MDKNNPLDTLSIKPEGLDVRKRENVLLFGLSIQIKKRNTFRYEQKQLCNLGLLKTYKRQGRFIMAKVLEATIAAQLEQQSSQKHQS